MKRRIISLLSLVLIGAGLVACSDSAPSYEITRWQILADQDPSIEKAKASTGWQPVTVPTMFVAPYPVKRAIQYVWFRAEFELDNPAAFQGISLGRVYFIDRVYINGTMVGQRWTTEFQDLHYPRNYPIPDALLKKGKNEVYIYLGLYGIEYGGLSDRIVLKPGPQFLRTTILQEFLYRQLTVGILVLFFAQMIFSIIMLAVHRKDPVNLITAGIFILWITYLAAIFSPYYPFSIDFRISYLWACEAIAPILFYLFITHYYRVFLPWITRIFIPVMLILATLPFINMDTTSPWYLGRISGIITLVICIPVCFYTILHTYRVKQTHSIIYVSVFGIMPAMVIVFDIIGYLWFLHYAPLWHIYFLPAMVVLFMLLRIRDTVKKEIELEVLYHRLREQISDTRSMADRQGLTLTASMEKKLQSVIEFLRENFRSDISREGLARTMDLSPDHMSRMFKSYTGKRINDYINELRIEEAMKLLTETDEKIIDIAFAVGFESLVTFNRAFLKVKNMTPSEYRNSLKYGGHPGETMSPSPSPDDESDE